jgi:[NiFe] hydrogenase assembly HybE family chaperone
MAEAAVAHDTIPLTVQRLEAAFRAVAAGPMRDLPLNHARLQVQAAGFEALRAEPGVALGVLVTPWCMNLLRVPLHADVPMLPVGRKSLRALGAREFEFIGAHEPAFGPFEMCSLFSPVLEFADHDAAAATAQEVLALLRADASTPPAAADAGGQPAVVDAGGQPAVVEAGGQPAVVDAGGRPAGVEPEAPPSRRGFLFGRVAQPAR